MAENSIKRLEIDEILDSYTQSLGESPQIENSDVLFSPLHHAYVCAVNPRQFAELLLRHTHLRAQLAYLLAYEYLILFLEICHGDAENGG
jgi:hypothetical protein